MKKMTQEHDRTPSFCPKTGKAIKHKKNGYRWLIWLLPITGLSALMWFLIRVIPKPSRATYPCQRMAFPLASGFVVWLTGLIGSAAAYHKAKRLLAQSRYALAAICIVAGIVFVWIAMNSTEQELAYAHEPIVPNSPLGTAKGIFPGRVAWIHDPDATSWQGSDGDTTAPYWHENVCTDLTVVSEMLSKALRALTDRSNDTEAWDAIFKDFNQQMGRGYVGYTPGQKIAIKVNFVLMYSSPSNGEKPASLRSQIDNSPQLAIALLKQLIDVAGVNPSDISVGDPLMMMPNHWYNMVSAECPGVVYLSKSGYSLSGRTQVSLDHDAPLYWSDPDSSRFVGVTNQDYIPTHFAQSDYFIDCAVLKSHNDAGVTLGGKNHFGSLARVPNASGYYNMHSTRATETPGIGHYRAIVDLLGHPKLGGKTMLTLIDGLYSGRSWDSHPIRWNMPPFNGDWPNSIFLSQDPVAADSVAFDFMDNEWNAAPDNINGYPQKSGTEDYLQEAALVLDPPSGTHYDPAHDGGLTKSLGVHEHWNNPIDKQYSRNLDQVNGNGIELVTGPGMIRDFCQDGFLDFKDFGVFAAAWRSQAGDENWNPACDISPSIDGVIDERDLEALADHWLDIFSLVQPGATLQEVYSVPGVFFEGPTWNPADDRLYFSRRNTPYQTLRLDAPGSVTAWQNPSPQTNGTFLSIDGRLLTADESTKQIRSLRLDPDGPGDPVVLADSSDGFTLMPNDLCQLHNGNIYFTTPDWGGAPISQQGVFLLEPDGTATRVNNTLTQPNGVIASLDGSRLYVAESGKSQWWVFNIAADGTLDAGTVFFKPTNPNDPRNVPDGMTIDEFGNLYFSGLGGVWAVSPQGELLDFIDTPTTISNVTFGGADGRTLYMTCQDKVYSLEMCVRGVRVVQTDDTEPPIPNPMEWANGGEPSLTDNSRITMTAVIATDTDSPPVTYYFECTTDDSVSSTWQTNPNYTTPKLDPFTQYTFRVKARDRYPALNETEWSREVSVTTGPASPELGILGDWTTGTTHNPEPGQNRALVFFAHAEHSSGTVTLNSVRYGGQPMTKVIDKVVGTGYTANVTAFILDEAGIEAASNGTFVPVWDTTPGAVVYTSVFLEDVDQTSMTGDEASASTTTSNPIMTDALFTEEGDIVFVAATCGNMDSYTLNNGFTEGFDQQFGDATTGGTAVAGYKCATGVVETPNAAYNASINRQVIIGFVVKEE